MSNYETFFQDFPSRCFELVDALMPNAQGMGREVTFTLAMATSAFVIPFERLNSEPGLHLANDAVKYTEARERFVEVLKDKFFAFYSDGQDKSWRIISAIAINKEEFSSNPLAYWETLGNQRQQLDNFDTKPILKILRNALAHGNIFTIPRNEKTDLEIEILVFVSNVNVYEKAKRLDNGKRCSCMVSTGEYDVIMVSPTDFLQFLQAWVKFVKSLPTADSQVDIIPAQIE